jgi:hypothetical protein
MNKLAIIPDIDNYEIIIKENVLATDVNYGNIRVRQDFDEISMQINCQWTLELDEYSILCTFLINNAGLKFNIDLITVSADLIECEVNLIPDSFKLVSQRGKTYVVKSSFELLVDNSSNYWIKDLFALEKEVPDIEDLLIELHSLITQFENKMSI